MRVVRSQGHITHQAFAFVVKVFDSLLRITGVRFNPLKIMTFDAKPNGLACVFFMRPLRHSVLSRRQGFITIPAERVLSVLLFGRYWLRHDPKRGCRYKKTFKAMQCSERP